MVSNCVGVILAGGRSSRMGGRDKAWGDLNGQALIEYVASRAAPQVEHLLLNTNSETPGYQQLNLPIVGDCISGHQGPLAGILSAMQWAAEYHPGIPWLASFAVDTPFIPTNLVEQMLKAVEENNGRLAYAKSCDRSHPVIGLWAIELIDDLQKRLTLHKDRKVERWTQRHSPIAVNFSADDFDPFFNINTEADLTEARKILQTLILSKPFT